MKKIITVLLIAVLMLSLTGCFGTGTSTPTETPTEVPALSTYTKDFRGLQQYLIDHSLIPYVKLASLPATSNEAQPTEAASTATEATTATESTDDPRTPVYYDLLGADYGIRYALTATAFVELYDFSTADNATAKAILADIKDDGKFTMVDGLDELTGVISKSGKYVIVYNEKNSYDDYAKITAVLENW